MMNRPLKKQAKALRNDRCLTSALQKSKGENKRVG